MAPNSEKYNLFKPELSKPSHLINLKNANEECSIKYTDKQIDYLVPLNKKQLLITAIQCGFSWKEDGFGKMVNEDILFIEINDVTNENTIDDLKKTQMKRNNILSCLSS